MNRRQRQDASQIKAEHNSEHSTKRILELAGVADMLSSDSDDTGDGDIANQNWQTVGKRKGGHRQDGLGQRAWPTASRGENQGWTAWGRHNSGNRSRNKSNADPSPSNYHFQSGDHRGQHRRRSGDWQAVPHREPSHGAGEKPIDWSQVVQERKSLLSNKKETGVGGREDELQVDWSQVMQQRLALLTGSFPSAVQVGSASTQISSSSGNSTQSVKADQDRINIDWGKSLSHQYELKFACDICYPKTGPGIEGRKLQHLAHHCTQNIFLAKSCDKNGYWTRIRPRPSTFPHKHVLCPDFVAGKPCSHELGEEMCDFPNTLEEKHFWDLDREGEISIISILGTGARGRTTEEVSDVRNSKYEAMRKIANATWVTQGLQGNHAAASHIEGSELYCKLCGIMCNGRKQMEQHRASKKHMENLNPKQNVYVPLKQVGKLKTRQKKSWQNRQPSEKDSDVSLYCEPCDVVCNSIKQKIHHCASKKHVENVAWYQVN